MSARQAWPEAVPNRQELLRSRDRVPTSGAPPISFTSFTRRSQEISTSARRSWGSRMSVRRRKAASWFAKASRPTRGTAPRSRLPSIGLAFHRRASAGALTTATAGGDSTLPVWVRLTRAGNLFCSYISLDGATWVLVGTETIPMAPSVYVGLAVTSHANTKLATVSFSDVSAEDVAPGPASPWSRGDVGSPALAGGSSEASGTFSVTGGGVDIASRSDQFHFVYQPFDGDLQITAAWRPCSRSTPGRKQGS